MDIFNVKIENITVEYAMAQVEVIPDLDSRKKNCLRLLTEEMFSMMENVLNNRKATFELGYDGKSYYVSIKADVVMTDKSKRTYMEMSTDGKNRAHAGIIGKMIALVEALAGDAPYYPVEGFMVNPDFSMNHTYMWSMAQYIEEQEDVSEDWDGMEKSIIANFADDVIIGVLNNELEMTVKKKF